MYTQPKKQQDILMQIKAKEELVCQNLTSSIGCHWAHQNLMDFLL